MKAMEYLFTRKYLWLPFETVILIIIASSDLSNFLNQYNMFSNIQENQPTSDYLEAKVIELRSETLLRRKCGGRFVLQSFQ